MGEIKNIEFKSQEEKVCDLATQLAELLTKSNLPLRDKVALLEITKYTILFGESKRQGKF